MITLRGVLYFSHYGWKTFKSPRPFRLEHRRARALDRTRLARRSVWNCGRHHEKEKCPPDLSWRHVRSRHLYASLPSTTSIADFVNTVKSNSSRWVHESFATRKGFAWQEGYGAFSVSKSEEQRVIRRTPTSNRGMRLVLRFCCGDPLIWRAHFDGFQRAAKQRSELSPRRGFASLGLTLQ